jgi:hypothetical protein
MKAARAVKADLGAIVELEGAHVAVEHLARARGHLFLAVDLRLETVAAREAIADQAVPFVMLGDEEQALAAARSVTALRKAAGSTKRSLSPFGEKPCPLYMTGLPVTPAYSPSLNMPHRQGTKAHVTGSAPKRPASGLSHLVTSAVNPCPDAIFLPCPGGQGSHITGIYATPYPA